MNTTAQSLAHLALIVLFNASIAALAIFCCPGESHGGQGDSQDESVQSFKLEHTPGFKSFEREMMRACLTGRTIYPNHNRMESPDERLEYCIAQIKNYRSLM